MEVQGSVTAAHRKGAMIDMTNEGRLYIAYGSNTNIRQMANRCRTAKPVGIAVLTGYRLLFRGEHRGAVATVEPHKDGRVPVLAWLIKDSDEAALDRYEGFPFLYRKEYVEIELNGEKQTAMVYIMNDRAPVGYERPLGLPNAGYYATILEGYKSAGFDIEILRQATTDSAAENNGKRRARA